jgi:hypothetical protein
MCGHCSGKVAAKTTASRFVVPTLPKIAKRGAASVVTDVEVSRPEND